MGGWAANSEQITGPPPRLPSPFGRWQSTLPTNGWEGDSLHLNAHIDVPRGRSICDPATNGWEGGLAALPCLEHAASSYAIALRLDQEVIATVRGWRRPMTSTQIVPMVATAAIGIKASGKLPVSAWIQPIR